MLLKWTNLHIQEINLKVKIGEKNNKWKNEQLKVWNWKNNDGI